MKVIFLDIDGVLVNENHLSDLLEKGRRISDFSGRHVFDPKCVENLKRILDVTGAKIVLSSAWRMFGEDGFRKIWAERNMPSEIMDFTPHAPTGMRGHEISMWLDAHKDDVESFVIIDDDVFDFHNNQMPLTVKTTWKEGLTDDATEKAINILNSTSV